MLLSGEMKTSHRSWDSTKGEKMERVSYSLRCTAIIDLIQKLHQRGSWCGETHIQKAMYISQDLARANLGYKFIMYKHGPFSFELKDELSAMRASNMIELTFPRKDYGPSIGLTSFGERIYQVNQENIDRYEAVNSFVADWLSKNDVRSLEKIATAYYVTKRHPRESITARAKRVTSLKPHVDVAAAEAALRVVDQKRAEAAQHKF
jgi:hypothetical protein